MIDSRFFNTPGHLATRLVRNHDMVHKRQCYRVSGIKVTPWQWAEGKPNSEVATARENGLKFCKSCDPLDETAHWPPSAASSDAGAS